MTAPDFLTAMEHREVENMGEYQELCQKINEEHDRELEALVRRAEERGRLQGLDAALKAATDVEKSGAYFGEASVDTADSIYQQGACEVREAIEALKETGQ